MDPFDDHDFSVQEPALYGRNNREPIVTSRIHVHNQMIAQKADARLRRKNARQANTTVQPVQASTMAARNPPVQQSQTSVPPQSPAVQPPPTQLATITNLVTAAQPEFASEADADQFLRQLGPEFLSQFNFFSGAAAQTSAPPLASNTTSSDLSPEELDEIDGDPDADDPDAHGNEFSDFGTGLDSIRADAALANANQVVLNTNITSTPIPLRTQVLVRQGVSGQRTPTTASPQARLVRRSHTVLPSPAAEKENTPMMPTVPVTPVKRSHNDDPDGELDEDEEAAMIDDENIHIKKKGVRASDLSTARKRIVERAWRHFRFHVASCPYPTEEQVDKWAIDLWYAGLGELVEGLNYVGSSAPTENELALLRQRVSQLRGQIKIRAREVVSARLGLRNSADINNINKTRDIIQAYKDRNAFVYRNAFDRAEPESLFRSVLIEDIFCRMWYNERAKSEAVLTPMYFENGTPLETIALVCAGIQNVLDEWQTGTHVKIAFSAKVYEPVYEAHLTNLRKWYAYTSTRQKGTEKLQKDLLIKGREHAGVDVTPEGPGAFAFTDADFAFNE